MPSKIIPPVRLAPARLTRKRLWILLEAAICLTCAKLLVRGIPFRLLVLTLGRKNRKPPSNCANASPAPIADIGSALRAIGRRLIPLRQCLPQAIAAYWMARRRNVSSTLYLGARIKAGHLSAHAWLGVGDRFVVGGESRDGYHVIAAFGDDRDDL